MHPKTEKNPRGAGRKKKYATEEERREGYLARKLRYNRKLDNRSERVVAYLNSTESRKLEAIMARAKIASKAAAVRWLIEQQA